MKGGFFPTKSIDAFALWANILNATEGRFFTVLYRKKDCSVRRLNGRIYEKIDTSKGFEHLIVRDVKISAKKSQKDGGYRKIDPHKIIAFKCGSFQIGIFPEQLKANSTDSANIL